jgi:acetolactate synthase-1/2/3 large subunit
MPRLTGGQAVVQSLEAEGARVAYGVLGSHLMPTYDALYDSPIKLITPRDRRSAERG